jgi:hypothetical protein
MSQKEIDHAIRTTFRNPPILASEDRAQYEDLKRLVLSDIKPRGLQETLLARDIVWVATQQEHGWRVRYNRGRPWLSKHVLSSQRKTNRSNI